MLQPYLISMANYVCYFPKTVLCLAPLAAVALEKDRSVSASPAVMPMAGHKAQLRCLLSLSGAVITVTPSSPQTWLLLMLQSHGQCLYLAHSCSKARGGVAPGVSV